MGNIGATPEGSKSKAIVAKLKKDHEEQGKVVQILLLGTGESGKSTFVKQMRHLYGRDDDISEETMLSRRGAVFRTVLESMTALLKASEDYYPLSNTDLTSAKEAVIATNSKVLSTPEAATIMDNEMKNNLIALWNDDGIRKTWKEHRSLIQAQESLAHFMKDASRVLHNGFKVKEIDWLHARLRTTGVVHENFVVGKNELPIKIIDVGGQRSERRKWIHVFSNVTSVMFVSAVSEFDEVLFEDNEVNRLEESLNLFEEMVNHEAFMDSGMILFLNKKDLFEEKLTRIPIAYTDSSNPMKNRWTDFQGPNAVGVNDYDSPEFIEAYEAGIDYFFNKFFVLNQQPNTKIIYPHVTFALDDDNVLKVLQSCWHVIIEKVLKGQGFVQ